VLHSGVVTLDRYARRVEVAGQRLELSPKEFGVLEYLLRNAGQVLSRDQILEHVWGYDADLEGNNVDLYVHYLRRKLVAAGAGPLIETVRGAGYTIPRRA